MDSRTIATLVAMGATCAPNALEIQNKYVSARSWSSGVHKHQNSKRAHQGEKEMERRRKRMENSAKKLTTE